MQEIRLPPDDMIYRLMQITYARDLCSLTMNYVYFEHRSGLAGVKAVSKRGQEDSKPKAGSPRTAARSPCSNTTAFQKSLRFLL